MRVDGTNPGAPSTRRAPGRGTAVLRIRRSVLVLGFGLLSTHCAIPSPPLESREATSGALMSRLLPSADSSVVLVYDPADCFTCYGALQSWLDWGKRNPGAFALVFTRSPNADEQALLTAYRVKPDATLRRTLRDWVAPVRTPSEHLYVGGRLVTSTEITGRGISTPLLDRVQRGTR